METTSNGHRTNNEKKTLRLLGTYVGHTSEVWCAMEKDDNTLITGSCEMKVWNTTTCKCLSTLLMFSAVWSLLKKKSKSSFVCGMENGTIEIRRLSDLGLLSSFKMHSREIFSICELEDGSFVSGSHDKLLKRWDETGRVVQTFSGHSHWIYKVIELKNDIIVSASEDKTVKMWRVSSGECVRTLTQSHRVYGLVKLNDRMFVSGSRKDKSMVVWDHHGFCIETHKAGSFITAMTRLRDGSIVTADPLLIEIRWYREMPFQQRRMTDTNKSLSSLSIKEWSLVELCCRTIRTQKNLFAVEELKEVLPQELYRRCFS